MFFCFLPSISNFYFLFFFSDYYYIFALNTRITNNNNNNNVELHTMWIKCNRHLCSTVCSFLGNIQQCADMTVNCNDTEKNYVLSSILIFISHLLSVVFVGY